MAGKILFVDDECTSLKTPHAITNTLHEIGNAEEKVNSGTYKFAESFEKAVQVINEAGRGEDYSWFFIDRNLGEFSDIKNKSSRKIGEIEFKHEFFECFKRFEGDYLYFLLRKAGVPIEKICFLTANDPSSNGEASGLRATPFLFETEKPNCIIKLDNKQCVDSAGNDDDDGSTSKAAEEKLKEMITKTEEVQIRFVYKDIFENSWLEGNFRATSLLNDFLKLLKKCKCNEKFDQNDGMTLRNMVEILVDQIMPSNEKDISVRKFLNDSENQYHGASKKEDTNDPEFKCNNRVFSNLEDKEIKDFWLSACKIYKPFPTETNKSKLESFYQKKGWKPDDAKKIAEYIIDLSTATPMYRLLSMQYVYSVNWDPKSSLPPKYIFSYIDNIYTVTSEWSAHGKNLTKTDELSLEGWKTLVYGMCQILQWFAKKHPNQ